MDLKGRLPLKSWALSLNSESDTVAGDGLHRLQRALLRCGAMLSATSVPYLSDALRENRIEMLLADRGTYGRPLMRALKERKIPYIIAAPRNKRTDRPIKNTKPRAKPVPDKGRFYHETKITIKRNGPPLTTSVVLFWRPDNKNRNLVCFPFATSETSITPERAHELAYPCLKRWSIETGDRIKNKLRVRTCGPHTRNTPIPPIPQHPHPRPLGTPSSPRTTTKRTEKLSLRAF